MNKLGKPLFDKELKKNVFGLLSANGFEGDVNEQRKLHAPVVACIWFQPRSDKKACSVNLGVDFSFMHADLEKVRQPDCEIKTRLRVVEGQDQWWDYAEPEQSVSEIQGLLVSRGLPFLQSYFSFPGKLLAVTAQAVTQGQHREILPAPPVRACLLLARMYEFLGDRNKMQEFAVLGIELAGSAVSVRASLKKLLDK